MDKTQLPSNFLKHKTKNPIQKFLINNFYSTFFSLINTISPKKILDAGCGEGFTLQKLYENKIGKDLEGIDFSKEAITLGKNQFPHLTLKTGDIYKLPYKTAEFDLATCMEVLEHLENPYDALREIIRVSNNYVLFSVPNEPFFTLSNFLRGKYLSTFGNHPEHIQHWTFYSFPNLLKKHGISIVSIKLPFPWIMVLGRKNN